MSGTAVPRSQQRRQTLTSSSTWFRYSRATTSLWPISSARC